MLGTRNGRLAMGRCTGGFPKRACKDVNVAKNQDASLV